MANDLILITGATGKTGRRVTALLENVKAPTRAVSRQSNTPFDWNNDETWQAALVGAKAVYIVHPDLGSSNAAAQVGAFAKLAFEAGVLKAVLVSTPDDGSDFSKSMRAAEKRITEAGIALTSLRLRWFFQNFSEDFLLPSVQSGEMRLPAGDGKEAFVDADDIAEVAVAALTDDRHNGQFYDLTGPQLLSFADAAETISRGSGHAVKYLPLEADTFVAEQIALGVPEEWAHTLTGLYQDIAQGKLQTISGDIEAVLGKPPRDFESFVAETARAGVWNTSVG